MRNGRLRSGFAGILFALATGGCAVVGTTPERPRPRVETGPPPDVERGIDLRDVTLRPVRDFDEVRALWVVRFTMTSEESVRLMVERADEAGINTLIVQVRGRADAFYASSLEPRAESMRAPSDVDLLALTVDLAHARGIAVHAWVNTHLVWGPAPPPEDPSHLVNANPDWLAVPRRLSKELAGVDPFDRRFFERLVEDARANPRTVEGIYTSPSHPAVQNRVHAVWLDLATRYDLDGIHFDYIRYPSAEYDYSVGALERFRLWTRSVLTSERFGELDAMYVSDLYAFVDGEPGLWADFRRHHVTRLVERIYEDVKAVRPRLVVSAAVVPDVEVAFGDRFQDWTGWLERGIVDVAVPMAYTPDVERFEGLLRRARAEAGQGARLWAGIGAYMNSADDTIRMIDVARAVDAGGVVIFSYDWAVDEGLGDPANPLLQRLGRERFGR